MPVSGPKVSVIVPSYNHARYLAQRLDSILMQTFQDFELIFLDDASPDHTREVFAPYAGNPRIWAVFNGQNSGSVFAQWNRGLEMARGEYVWIAESDDYAHPELLATLVGSLDSDPEAGVAYCDSTVVDPEGKPMGLISGWSNEIAPGRWCADFVNQGREEIRQYLVQRNTIPNASAVVFRRACQQALGPVRTDYRLSGDWAFWVAMLSGSSVCYVSRPLNYFRKHPRSVTSGSHRESRDIEEHYRLVAEIADRHSPDPAALEASRRHLAETWFWRSQAPGAAPDETRRAIINRLARATDPRFQYRWAGLWLRMRRDQIRRRLPWVAR